MVWKSWVEEISQRTVTSASGAVMRVHNTTELEMGSPDATPWAKGGGASCGCGRLAKAVGILLAVSMAAAAVPAAVPAA